MDHIEKPYWLYMLECQGGFVYAGIALDVNARFQNHVSGRGAAFTKINKPIRILRSKMYANKGLALAAEYKVKQLSRLKKIAFLES